MKFQSEKPDIIWILLEFAAVYYRIPTGEIDEYKSNCDLYFIVLHFIFSIFYFSSRNYVSGFGIPANQ